MPNTFSCRQARKDIPISPALCAIISKRGKWMGNFSLLPTKSELEFPEKRKFRFFFHSLFSTFIRLSNPFIVVDLSNTGVGRCCDRKKVLLFCLRVPTRHPLWLDVRSGKVFPDLLTSYRLKGDRTSSSVN